MSPRPATIPRICRSARSSPSRPSGSEAEMERQDPILGRGWSFPMTTESRGPILVGGAEKVEQSLRLILFTTPGERVLRPEFGCGLRDLVFRPNTTTFRSEEHTSELQSLMLIPYAVFCLKKQKIRNTQNT